tara:strand:+ start:187129 stop:187701 length:573 start_codon:yes stop_codon:yes gene_type:complete
MPQTPDSVKVLSAERIEHVFNRCFAASCNTLLCGGAAEPFYRPADAPDESHYVYYREDFFASALHEVAHWCIAGRERRLQPDFGYWYVPDGRSPEQQAAFERVECRPQALEWLFAHACGASFHISVDNLDGAQNAAQQSSAFAVQVFQAAQFWQQAGLPERADQFYRGLCEEFGTSSEPAQLRLSLEDLL